MRIAAARIDEFAARMDLARSGLYPRLGCDGQAHARHGRSATDAHGRERAPPWSDTCIGDAERDSGRDYATIAFVERTGLMIVSTPFTRPERCF